MNLHRPVKVLFADKETAFIFAIFVLIVENCDWISLLTLLKYPKIVVLIPLIEVLNFNTSASVVPVINVVGVVKDTFVNLFCKLVIFVFAVVISVALFVVCI